MQDEVEVTESTPTGPETDDAGSDAGDERLFSQAEVDKLLGKTRRQATQATTKQIAEKLGVTPDEAAVLIAEAKERKQAEMSEAEKARAEAEEAKAEAVRVKAEAQAARLRGDLAVALTSGEPINPDRLDMALSLAVTHAAGLDGSDDPVADAAGWVREQSPEWFQAKEEDPVKKPAATPTAGRRTNGESSGGDSSSPVTNRFEEWKKSRKTPGLNL